MTDAYDFDSLRDKMMELERDRLLFWQRLCAAQQLVSSCVDAITVIDKQIQSIQDEGTSRVLEVFLKEDQR